MDEIDFSCDLCDNVVMSTDERVKIWLALGAEWRDFFDAVRAQTGLLPVDFLRIVFLMYAEGHARKLGIEWPVPNLDKKKVSQKS